MSRARLLIGGLVVCSLAANLTTVHYAYARTLTGRGEAATQNQDNQKDKKEMGSDKKTGGPTQKDRDTVRDIQKGSGDLKDRVAKEKKEREKKDKKP